MDIVTSTRTLLSRLQINLRESNDKIQANDDTLFLSSCISSVSTAHSLSTLFQEKTISQNSHCFLHKAFLVFHGAFIVLLGILATSCQRFDDETEELATAEAVSLNVMTRSAEANPIQYPVELFAFTVDGKYAGSKSIESEEETITFNLPKGEYRLVALSGLTDDYDLPEKPTAEDAISFTNKQYANNPLMYGTADVTLSEKNTKATIVLSYTVAAVQIKLTHITHASSVEITIASLFPSLSFSGDFTGDAQKIHLTCQQDEEGNWFHDTFYIFPGAGDKTTFSITIEEDEDVQTFGYTYEGIPEANHPFNIVGNYNETLSIEGLLESSGWAEPINVNFKFGNNINEEDDGDEGNEVVDPDGEGKIMTADGIKEIPKVGDIYEDCIVAKVDGITDSTFNALLLSLDEWEGKEIEVEKKLKGYSVNGIENWRLPSHNEAKQLIASFNNGSLTAINKKIASSYQDKVQIPSVKRYLCMKGNDKYSFVFDRSGTISMAGPKKIYQIRPVIYYRFSLL